MSGNKVGSMENPTKPTRNPLQRRPPPSRSGTRKLDDLPDLRLELGGKPRFSPRPASLTSHASPPLPSVSIPHSICRTRSVPDLDTLSSSSSISPRPVSTWQRAIQAAFRLRFLAANKETAPSPSAEQMGNGVRVRWVASLHCRLNPQPWDRSMVIPPRLPSLGHRQRGRKRRETDRRRTNHSRLDGRA
ncbi:hypothetical protein IE53DRAFT_235342 [Violaceomyces palustris]|uniref:Uncharacterized protein n=1 Tax=Violaceomyces palustris TaxID=1673888 RepID=A0ACD0NPD1_9BASI|nr:hypothetical protein IE53DRAFT_235342 [Violaceomyces palustris]